MFEQSLLETFWVPEMDEDPAFASQPFTEQILLEVQKALGVRLPASYVALMRSRNGGLLNRMHFPFIAPDGEPDDAEIQVLFGIGSGPAMLLSEDRVPPPDDGSPPQLRIFVGGVYGSFEGTLMLDYGVCGPEGEPTVVYLPAEVEEDFGDFEGEARDEASDEDPHERPATSSQAVVLAPDFETFVRGLLDDDALISAAFSIPSLGPAAFEPPVVEPSATRSPDAPPKRSRRKRPSPPLTPTLEAALSASASPADSEAALRRLLDELGMENGEFALDEDPKSHLVYDVLFSLYTTQTILKDPEDFADVFISMLVSGRGFLGVPAFPLYCLMERLDAHVEQNVIVNQEGRFRFTEAHQRKVLEAFAAYLPTSSASAS